MALRMLDSTDDALRWLAQHGARGLAIDSRRVRAGDAFIAWPGHAVDGRDFVPQALAAGASACVVEAEGAQAFGWDGAESRVAAWRNLKAGAGPLASAYHGSPSARLTVLAITGTNGKTSTAWWLAQAFAALGRRCAVIGTLGIGEPASTGSIAGLIPTGMTTPDPVTLQASLKRFVDDGVSACAIEATSIGLAEHRLAGTRIDIALFTNLTQDHLDYHGSMHLYRQAKEALFAWPGLRAAVINVDDAHGAALAASLRGSTVDVWTCSASPRSPAARLRAGAIRHGVDGLSFTLHEGDSQLDVATPLVGAYNVENLLTVIGGLRAAGVALADAVRATGALNPVPGRMQRIDAAAGDGPRVVVDYAHTPDALEHALRALQPLAAARSGRLWCVFGCGGNRDAGKRPLMGAIAQRLAQCVVVTSDNPRREVPAEIVRQIVAGMDAGTTAAQVIEDRRAAIVHAVHGADARDVVLIAGKGHEDYQEIDGMRQPFCDVDEAGAALRSRPEVTR